MRYAIVGIVALFGLACDITGPRNDLSGHWTAQGVGHTLLFGFTLMQSGDLITGKACAVSDGTVLYKDVPVVGDYPDVQFTVGAANTQPCCPNAAGMQFVGKQDSTKDIVGTYANGDLRFKRAIVPLCN